MNHGTKRSTPRLSPKAASIQGTPGVSILSCLTGSPIPGDGARGAQPMSWCSRQHICEGVGDALGPQEIRTFCTERASLVWIGTDARKWSGQEAGSIATQSRE